MTSEDDPTPSGKLAHDLRNPLGSALMALTLLRPRLTAPDNLRLLDMLERNLRRVEAIIDDRLAPRAGESAHIG